MTWDRIRAAGYVALLLGALACRKQPDRDVILATTTSVQDSGLLDALVPAFERESGLRVKAVAVGTGQALALGARGEADLVLVHAPSLERDYMARGDYASRRLLMHNSFVVVGPPGDPAGARAAGSGDVVVALRRIADSGAVFISRGDRSGTHLLETALWEAVGARPGSGRYHETGQGIGPTLMVASEKEGYTLTDRATFLAMKGRIDLEPVVEQDERLLNIYHVMEADAARHPSVNREGAAALAAFLLSPETQRTIGAFGMDRYGEGLFVPDAGKAEPDSGRE